MAVKGSIYIVAAPSGGGKTSLVKALTKSMQDMEVSISYTTREQRPGEVDGVHYFFVSKPDFINMANNGEFIEHARVFDQYYGTSAVQVDARLKAGKDVVLDIDWQGAEQIRELYPASISIFVIPPSLEILKQRLQARGRDSDEVIADRMAKAQQEMSHYGEFDYLLVNDDFEQTCQDIQAIVRANRLCITKQSMKQAKLLSFLLGSL